MDTFRTEILCTLGPASLNEQVIKRLTDLGVGLFRINLSHTKAADLSAIIDQIHSYTNVPICLDTEGAQIRTGDFLTNTIDLRENSLVRGYYRSVSGDSSGFNFYPPDIVREFEAGDFISVDFNSVLVQVIGHEDDSIVLRVINGGTIGRNKAVTVDRDIALDALTKNDRASIEIGIAKGLSHFALSFASSQKNVDEIRRLTGPDKIIISKIESLSGLAQLNEIAEASEALLIDRGDLSRQIPLERIPEVQKAIIRTAKCKGRKVFVATNLLESMITSPTPTRAEVNDIYNTLLDGADGLVLAAETAIGAHPIACVSMVVKMIRNFEAPEDVDPLTYPFDPISLLVEPHGGHLVQRYAGLEECRQAMSLPRLLVSDTTLLDCEQIAHGTYSPLTGFMDRRSCEAVLEANRLLDGTLWTMPILLPASEESTANFDVGDRIALVDRNNIVHATLDVMEKFSLNLESIAEKWFGTASREHPGVARLLGEGNHFIAGAVSLVERLNSPYRHYELTPAQTRFIFAHKGWSKVVGFHTRNPIHRGHEYIQLKALEITGADGLYINPVIGPKKAGDFLPEPIMKSYQTMLEFELFPKGRVILGSFATYSRYGGPREAVFTALCRKNMGCSHFIIGRDHTGVGDFYSADANQAFMESLGDFGIQPLFFDAVAYDPTTGQYGTYCPESGMFPIDGTQVRDRLRDRKTVPDWIMRKIVQDVLRSEEARRRPLFVE